jgi:CubicO group peptidase (beta-lactamase class C family)
MTMTIAHAVLALSLLGAAHAAFAAPTQEQRSAAAQSTAQSNAACKAVQPFYWSVGDAHGVLADGSAGRRPPTATTQMPIASASKLVYAAFVAQQRHGQLTDDDVRFLHFTSGYTHFKSCRRGQTVAECDAMRDNGEHDRADDGKFFYNGGHMQRHAVLDGLGPLDDEGLARTVNQALGTSFRYAQPQLAGGISTSAADYGDFLRRIVAGQLQIKALLGTHAVCTNPKTCPTAAESFITADVHYSIGHWVEDDPDGDGAFSSAGAFGFYPWISKDETTWGVLARFRFELNGAKVGTASLMCGRQIRAAWASGEAR